MASVQFQIHTDKENAASAGGKTVGGGFQGGKSKGFQDHKVPRKALGSVNEADRVDGRKRMSQDLKQGIPALPSSSGALKPKNTLTQKDSKLKGLQSDKENAMRSKKLTEKGSSALKTKQQPSSGANCLPDIEYMPQSSSTDEDDDVLPPRKRTTTYVHKLLSWRPPCFFSNLPDSEEEEEEEMERQRIMEELDNLPLPNDHDHFPSANLRLSREELDIDSIELPSMDDVPLPFIDDPTTGDEADSSPLPPLLDDSVGLLPHLGSLELLDSSLPTIGPQ